MSRTPDTLDRVRIKLAAGTWIPISRPNAMILCGTAGVQVEIRNHGTRYVWAPLVPGFGPPPRTLYRARKTPPAAPVWGW